MSQLGDNVVYVQKWPWGGGGEYAWWKYLNRPVPLSKESDLLRKRSQYAENVAFGTSLGGATAKRNGMDAGGVEVLGITYEYNQIWDFDLKEGRYFTENEMYGGKSYCIIGANIEEGLFPGGESALGEQISIRGQKLTVIGVFEKVGRAWSDRVTIRWSLCRSSSFEPWLIQIKTTATLSWSVRRKEYRWHN